MKEKEIWKAIPGFEGYEASNLGEIRSLNYNGTGKTKALKSRIRPDGYLSVSLYKKRETKGISHP